jgi:hypothetical protein
MRFGKSTRRRWSQSRSNALSEHFEWLLYAGRGAPVKRTEAGAKGRTLYFLPSIVAIQRHHDSKGGIGTLTLISGIRLDGPCAPWLFERPIGEMFLACVEQGLAPALRAGEVVILDNLATHKIRGVRQPSRRTACLAAALFSGLQSHRIDVKQD